MNDDARLGPDTAERMLRGEPTGPPRLAAILATASSEPPAEKLDGEEAAVAAFREARSLAFRQPDRRRLTVAVCKAALVGLLLVLVGGAAIAATGRHLPGPLGNRQSHHTRTPTVSETLRTRTPPRTSPHRAPGHQDTPDRQTTPTAHATHSAHPTHAPSTGESDRPHPTKKPKTKASKSNPNEPAKATRSAATPTTGATRRPSTLQRVGNSME